MDAKQQACAPSSLSLACYFSPFIKALYGTEVMATFTEFVVLVDSTLRELELEKPVKHSQRWYAINHLNKLSMNCHSSSSAEEVRNSVKSMMHFAIDCLDWKSELSKKLTHISEYHLGLMKSAQ